MHKFLRGKQMAFLASTIRQSRNVENGDCYEWGNQKRDSVSRGCVAIRLVAMGASVPNDCTRTRRSPASPPSSRHRRAGATGLNMGGFDHIDVSDVELFTARFRLFSSSACFLARSAA